jgi:hypothetical protein
MEEAGSSEGGEACEEFWCGNPREREIERERGRERETIGKTQA